MHEAEHTSHEHPLGAALSFLLANSCCGRAIKARKGKTPLADFLKKSLLDKLSSSNFFICLFIGLILCVL